MRDIFYIYTFTLLIGACLVILKSDLELKKKLIICLGILAMCLVTEFMTAYIYPQCTNISEPESFRTRPSASTLNISEEFTTTIFVPSPTTRVLPTVLHQIPEEIVDFPPSNRRRSSAA